MIRILLVVLGIASVCHADGEIRFRKHVIDANFANGYQVSTADIDSDGDLDVIALSTHPSQLVWYRNPTWERFTISARTQRNIDCAPYDIDGDGDMDLAVASDFDLGDSQHGGTLQWLDCPPDPVSIQEWEVHPIDAIPTSHRVRWADIEGGGAKVLVNLPIIGVGAEPPDYAVGVQFNVYRIPDDPRHDPWPAETLDSDLHTAHGLCVVHWDHGRDALLTGSFEGVHLLEWSANGVSKVLLGEGHAGVRPAQGSSEVGLGKLPSARTRFVAAIEPWHGHEVVVYTGIDGRDVPWQRTVIDATLEDGHGLVVVDVDGDGHDEIVAGGRGGSHDVNLYRWTRSGGWEKQTIDPQGVALAGLTVADINGDGRPDLAATGTSTHNVVWYENLSGPTIQGFVNPPLSARPRAYWDWLNGAVSLEQLSFDLQEMKAAGMGGAQMWDAGALQNPGGMVPAGPPFLGEASVAYIQHALKEAGRLGLEPGLLTSSGWNAGGAWVTPEMAGKNLYVTEAVVEGPGNQRIALPLPPLPEHCPRDDAGAPRYMRDVSILAFPDDENTTIARGGVVVLESAIADDAVEWEVPEGRWRVMRFVCLNNGQHLIAASPNSNGLMIDFLDPEATRFHFRYILDRLGITPETSAAFGLRYLAVESMELEQGIQWTDGFVSDFQRWCGYDIVPWLPVLAGWTVGDDDISQRFLYDYRKAVSEQLIYSHYITGNALLDRYGIDLSGEAGGPGPPIWNSCPVDALKALGHVDVPQGEFWIRHRNMFLVKEISSAAHIYGKPIVDAEAFTTWRRWKDGPATLKRYADRAFCEGLNRVTYHTYASSPPEAGEPGRVYHAGADLNPRVTWWPMVRPFMDYLARCSYMLQQGRFVADVCYYYGDQAPNFWPAFHDVPEKPLLEGLGAGYDYDVVNSDVILNRMSVRDGRIVLPDGMSYAALQLCDQAVMPLEVLEKIAELVDAGATVLGPKPQEVSGLNDYAGRTEALRALAERVWASKRVIDDRSARDVLQSQGIGPDFTFRADGEAELDYVHRSAGEHEIYFVRNASAATVHAECTFRVREKRPQFWNPVDGSICDAPEFERVDQGTNVALTLPSGGSIFVVFVPAMSHAPHAFTPEPREVSTLEGPWRVRFVSGRGAPPEAVFDTLRDWTKHEDEGIRYYSGIATYRSSVDVPASLVDGAERIYLDLGDVRDIARVRVNGQDCGIAWTPPYRVDITHAAVAGANAVEIDIANMWINRLTGDLALPPEQRHTHTNATPPKRDMGGDEPWALQPAGLLGPVRIMAGRP